MTAKNARISLIVAMGANRVIGQNGALPWRLRTDMRRFKALTMGKPVLLGRTTWDSIGKPLPGRANLVLSRDGTFVAPGAWALTNLPLALAFAGAIAARQNAEEIFVIGGEKLYAQTLPMADRLYLTHVDASLDGDAHFPQFPESDFQESAQEMVAAGPHDAFATCFRVLDRRS